MRRRLPLLALLLAAGLALAGAAPPDGPERVGEGAVSTPQHEWAAALAPDGALWFSIADPNFVGATRFWTLLVSRPGPDGWGAPEVAEVSGLHSDAYPAFSPDGLRLYFSSDRPHPGKSGRDFDLWVAERAGEGWGEPRPLPAPVNGPGQEFSPSLAADGTLYFSSDRPGGRGGFDLYRAAPGGPVESLGPALNTPANETDAWIHPAGTFLLFTSRGHPGGLGGDDVWWSTAGPGGTWSAPRPVGAPVSSPAQEMSPFLSPDGRYLWFASRRGFGDAPSPQPLGWEELTGRLSGVENGAGNLFRVPVADLGIAPPAWEPHPYARQHPLPAPVVFGEGVISTAQFEGHSELAPDGREIYFTLYNRRFDLDTIAVSRFQGGVWSRPEVASFSGRWHDMSTGITPDGRRLLFASGRPRPGAPGRTDLDLWMVERQGDGWGEPRHLGALNSESDEVSPSLAADGTLYFCSTRPGGQGGWDVWRARPSGDGWREPENLGAPVNTAAAEWNVWTAPDQSLLLFMAAARPGGAGADDVWVSRRGAAGWSEPANVRAVNTPDNEFAPKLSPDGRYLFFSSNAFQRPETRRDHAALLRRLGGVFNGTSNIWQVDASVLP